MNKGGFNFFPPNNNSSNAPCSFILASVLFSIVVLLRMTGEFWMDKCTKIFQRKHHCMSWIKNKIHLSIIGKKLVATSEAFWSF